MKRSEPKPQGSCRPQLHVATAKEAMAKKHHPDEENKESCADMAPELRSDRRD
jgi:hypothetical protein